jgi:aminoglycoside 2'-N-acetyltransferase I
VIALIEKKIILWRNLQFCVKSNMKLVCQVARFCTELEDDLRPLLSRVFGPSFDQNAWANCLGGTHVTLRLGDHLVGHASAIDRKIWIEGKEQDIKYVEAVAIDSSLQNQQLGHTLMGVVNFIIHQSKTPGFLATSSVNFYRSLRWEAWKGSSYVQMADGHIAPSSPRGEIMFLQPSCVDLDSSKKVTIGWRNGDVW